MLARFSITPLGTGLHLGEPVADAIRIVEESGLDHQVTAMDTLIEGEWDEVMDVVRRCIEATHQHSERVSCSLKIDDWVGKSGRLQAKVESVEQALGHAVAK